MFVDAVGTGLSEAISPHRNEDFWSVDADGAVFRDFVTRWLAANGRTASPLFIYGESYGTVRAPLLTRLLETAGTPVAGLVIQSSILDYNSNCSITSRQTAGCGGFLPSYAAVGEYWNLVTPAGPDTAGFLDQVRSYADTVYEPLADQWLDEGSPSTPPAGADLATLQADTGLAQSWWSTHFDMDFDTYRHHLLADTVLGVYDGRMSARPGTPLAADDDPSNTFIYAPFQQAMGSVLAQLGFTPVKAAMLCLVANVAAGAYGAVGIPVIVGAQIGGVDVTTLSHNLVLLLQPLTFFVPFLLVVIVDGWRGLRETWPIGPSELDCVIGCSFRVIALSAGAPLQCRSASRLSRPSFWSALRT